MPSIFNLARMASSGIKFGTIGGIAGGIIGGISSDDNTATGRFGSIVGGALLGAAGGIGISKLGRAAAWSGVKRTPGLTWSVGKGLSQAAMRAGGFALRHPTASMYGALGLAGMYGLAKSGPQDANRSAKEMAQMAMYEDTSTGFGLGEGTSARQMERIAFESSTNGLVGGLHRGRHRGG
jgi:hypothetical protein